MRKPSVGEQELELLQVIAERGSMTTAEIADGFGAARGLARTTIHTMLERLRKKGYVTRTKDGKVYHYTATQPKSTLLTDQVATFMQRTLGGSLKPLAAYLANAQDLNEDELRELKAVVAELEAKQGGTDDVH